MSDQERAASEERRKERNRQYMRDMRANDPNGAWVEKERERNRLHGRRYQLKSKYGITLERWQEIYESQAGRCYLCEKPLETQRIDLDHDHLCCPGIKSCGRCLRGLAHQRCNQGIGQFDDDPAMLRRVADNLEAANRRLR